MSALLLAAALIAAPLPPTPAQIAACTPPHTVPTASAGRLRPKRLADLPPAYQMRAVLRRVGDCGVVDVRRDGAWVHELDGMAGTAPAPAGR
ncbi:MAG TPA: hypothetical protein VHZ26_05920 [Caulobacteraceae bacterium]|jgi:hypothetical protein|nr:hypothetical protein [Caulobacteraceae bacterium]